MNYTDFISKDKSLLIAPAGYGKTYSLAESLLHTPANEKQLILTHTHAGIASIKEKIKGFQIPGEKYHIETITGFAQRYVLAYYCKEDIPEQEDSSRYYPFIVEKATILLNFESIKRTIKYSYNGLFVDEYQDCTKPQHNLITALKNILPTRILGDPMQGIFGFNESLVDFEKDLQDFDNVYELEKPWRWFQDGNNKHLGETLIDIREILEKNKSIDIASYESKILVYKKIEENEIYVPTKKYHKNLKYLISNPDNIERYNSLLIIVPRYYENNKLKGSIHHRSSLKSLLDLSKQLTLLEAIDNKDFYSISKDIDDLVKNIGRKRKKIKAISDNVIKKIFNKSSVEEWIKEDRLINKKGEKSKTKKMLESIIIASIENSSVQNFLNIITYLKTGIKLKTKRHDLLNSIVKAMNISITENITVYEGMVNHRNMIRRIGRKVHGKCIGTTLLTKGLEFDTVVILNAHRFSSSKHFYVAITRACKELIVFSEKDKITFNE